MIKNVGTAERIGRTVLGIVLAIAGFNVGGGWMWLLLALAVVMVATSALSFCPIHQALGLSSLGNKLARTGKSG